jgi:2-octaprenyl-6-methoxyphenol hydroxylase
MNICIIGDSLTSLALAKNLINKKIKVSIYYTKKNNKFKNRTLGISKDNLDFIYSEIIKVKKNLFWGIKKIDIFNETKKIEKILEFKNKNKELFFMIRYNNFYNTLNSHLKKNKLYKKFLIKNDNFYEKILEEKKYNLIINCETNNEIYKSFFYKNFKKDYDSYAYSFIIRHLKTENKKASQVFTKSGPIAFLPISKNETSVVFSKKNENIFLNQKKFQEFVKKYNPGYKINFFGKFEKFKLNLFIARNYYYKKVMILGDGLHKVHPLAGQGFNMTLRDIRTLSKIINNRIDLGLELNYSIYEDFEKKTKHSNFIFSSGIDLIHEFFKSNSKYSTKLLKIIGVNKIFNKIFYKYANKGLVY